MKIEQRTIYISEDGKEFNSAVGCLEHEKSLEFSCAIGGYIEKYAEDYYCPEIRMDIAKAIAEHFKELIEIYNKDD